MKKKLAIISSDLHLQKRAWADRFSLCHDAIRSFIFICKTAAAENLPVIAAGDLLDKKKNESFLVNVIRKYADKVPFLFVQGDHDLQEVPWFSSLSKRSVWLHNQVVELENITIVGLDWTPASELPEALAKLESADVVVMHETCEAFVPPVIQPELLSEAIPSCGLAIIGDVHTSLRKSVINAKGDKVAALSPGSTCMQSVWEDPVKYAWFLYDDLSVEEIEIPTRKVVTLPSILSEEILSTCLARLPKLLEKTAAMAEALHQDLQMPIVRCRYSAKLQNVKSRLQTVVGTQAHCFALPLSETIHDTAESSDSEDEDETSPRAVLRQGPRALIHKYADEKKDPKLFDLLRALLRADADPAETLSLMSAAVFGKTDKA